MNSTRTTILNLFQKCIDSKLDLMTFCEDFTFHIINIEDEVLKNTCTELLDKAAEYMLNQDTKQLSPDSILKAADLFDLIRKTYYRITEE